jgi:hypothetical protein
MCCLYFIAKSLDYGIAEQLIVSIIEELINQEMRNLSQNYFKQLRSFANKTTLISLITHSDIRSELFLSGSKIQLLLLQSVNMMLIKMNNIIEHTFITN